MALSLVTDINYPGKHTYSLSALISSAGVATATTSVTNSLQTGMTVTIAGADQAEYNGDKVITIVDGTHFTFPVTGTPVSPATGTITAYGGKSTVPGIVQIDGYFFVMTEDAVIHNSELGDGTIWPALGFVAAQIEPGKGKALAKSQNYAIAFKEWSTEYFYNAANAAPGSPLGRAENGFALVGCASGQSVADVDGELFWVSQTKEKGRSVHFMNGLSINPVSTPDVERILNMSTLESVRAYGIKIAGHVFYILTLIDLDLTLAYDKTSQHWGVWSSLTPKTSTMAISSIARVFDEATVTFAAPHGLSDGDPLQISGANEVDYNGIFNVMVVSSTVVKIVIPSTAVTPATGTLIGQAFDESYFKLTHYVYALGRDLALHEDSGHLYEISEAVYDDTTAPIDVLIRTGKVDASNTRYKVTGRAEVIGNKVSSHAFIRWSNDDYQTFSGYRPLDLAAVRSVIRRCGNFRRRSYDIRHSAATPLQLAELQIDINGEE